MHPFFQIIFSLLPIYIDFPLDKIPNRFSESAYITGDMRTSRYIEIEICDENKRLTDIRNFFINEIHGWSYYQTIVSVVPGYMMKSKTMKIDYNCSFVVVSYLDGEYWVSIGKKISSPFPFLIDVDEGRCSKK